MVFGEFPFPSYIVAHVIGCLEEGKRFSKRNGEKLRMRLLMRKWFRVRRGKDLNKFIIRMNMMNRKDLE